MLSDNLNDASKTTTKQSGEKPQSNTCNFLTKLGNNMSVDNHKD